ncbi:MAG TPA: GTP cyclohydrolase II [Thermoanaerobaculia bacterium]|nr:GTP cyclohydrolase II [Thermoanaerobaculia bacterium]
MSTTPIPRAAASEVRRRKILDAALRCFSRSGLAETKMGDICAQAGVSTGSVYHHFAGKDQLAAALYIEGLRDYQRGFLAELRRHSTAERGIRAIVAHHIDWVVRHPDWARFLSQHRQADFLSSPVPHDSSPTEARTAAEPPGRENLAASRDVIENLNEAFRSEVAAWLLPFIERGEVARLPRELFAPVVMGPTLEYMTRWLATSGEDDPRRATEVLATAAWNALRVRRAEMPPAPKRARSGGEHPLASVEEAIEAIAAGRMVIVVDAADREDEGDFICAAEKVTPEIVHFMTRQGGGLFCMPVLPSLAQEKGFSMMVEHNTTPTGTPFTIPVDHRTCHTGISAAERARTVQAVLDPSSRPEDFRTPGHLFVLVAKEGGVLRRAGHTEATVDLARLAGLTPAGVLCEICSREGHGMAGAEELQAIAQEFQMPIVSIEDVIRYRREREQLVHRVPGADAELPTHYGAGRVIGYRVDHENQEPVALVFGDPTAVEAPLVRMHSSCLTGDLINSLRCDCGDQLQIALARIGEERAGVLVYLPQEGRGIGLIEKLRAYQLQDEGLDTVEANEALGYRADPRDYMVGLQILRDLGLRRIRLLTNNPKKVDAFVYSSIGIEVVDQVPLLAPPEPARERYLATKRDKMGHHLPA